jgi:hypothetical protein
MTIGEFHARKKNFANNLAVIRKNCPTSGVELDLNQFSDWSLEQFSSILGFKEGNGTEVNPVEDDQGEESGRSDMAPRGRGLQSYPAELDYRTKGACTGVKN